MQRPDLLSNTPLATGQPARVTPSDRTGLAPTGRCMFQPSDWLVTQSLAVDSDTASKSDHSPANTSGEGMTTLHDQAPCHPAIQLFVLIQTTFTAIPPL